MPKWRRGGVTDEVVEIADEQNSEQRKIILVEAIQCT